MAVSRSVFVVTAERPVVGGRMLARHEGQVVLVAGAIPGERVAAAVEQRTRGVLLARTVEVLESSPHRRHSPIDPACGGLTLSHVVYEHQVHLKRQIVVDALRRIGKVDWPMTFPFHASAETGYRIRARLRVKDGGVGFLREGTHEFCAAGPSGQLRPDTLAAAEGLAASARAAGLPVASLTISETVTGAARVALLEVDPAHGRLAATIGSVAGIDGWSATSTHDLARGVPLIHDEARDVGVDLPVGWSRRAGSFFQGNRYVVGPLLSAVLAQALGGRVLDLYAGVGLFAVPLAARGSSVLAVEGDPTSGGDLELNAAPWAERLDVQVAPVESALARLSSWSPDVVVVDPPRIGLSAEARARLLALRPRRIVYVSCDLATFARDAQVFGMSGFLLNHLEGFDMFPGTPHVETLAVFDRDRRH